LATPFLSKPRRSDRFLSASARKRQDEDGECKLRLASDERLDFADL
jgi:hypothetical protein